MFTKAQRKKAKIKLAVTGPSGSGKTMGALLLAKGLGGKIAVIDTENGSASLYADNKDLNIEFDVAEIHAPYEPQKFIKKLLAAQEIYDTVIIDSASHAWAGDGGILMQKNQMDARGGNSFTNWSKFTPLQEHFVSAILSAKCNVIVTMRSKQDYVLADNGQGKQVPKKVGLAPVQRSEMEYEFTTVFDIDMNHIAQVSKDRTGLFTDYAFRLSEETGKKIKAWLESGKEEKELRKEDHPHKPNFETPILHYEYQRLSTARTKAGWLADDVKDVLKEFGVSDPIKMKPSDYRLLCSQIESGMTPNDIILERRKTLGIETIPTDIDETEKID